MSMHSVRCAWPGSVTMDGSMAHPDAYVDESTCRVNARMAPTNASPSNPRMSGMFTKCVYCNMGERSARCVRNSRSRLASTAACFEGATSMMEPGFGGLIPPAIAALEDGRTTVAPWFFSRSRIASVSCAVTWRTRSASAETRHVHSPPAVWTNPSSSHRRERLIDRPGSFTHRGFLPGVVVILLRKSSSPSSSAATRTARVRSAARRRCERSIVSPMDPLCLRNFRPPTSTMSVKMTSPMT